MSQNSSYESPASGLAHSLDSSIHGFDNYFWLPAHHTVDAVLDA